jgi:carbon-monoxide dehydrogenase small subunit
LSSERSDLTPGWTPAASHAALATPASTPGGAGSEQLHSDRPDADLPDAPHHPIRCRVNGREHRATVEPRLLLSDFLRQDLGLTGTHVGCEHGVCGACTVLLDGEAVRSCLLFAVQADGRELSTVESLGTPERMHPLQEAFRAAHGLQCGFCTPGILMTLLPFLEEHPKPSEAEVREALSGNLCRCTGYQHIVDAVLAYAAARPAGS